MRMFDAKMLHSIWSFLPVECNYHEYRGSANAVFALTRMVCVDEN